MQFNCTSIVDCTAFDHIKPSFTRAYESAYRVSMDRLPLITLPSVACVLVSALIYVILRFDVQRNHRPAVRRLGYSHFFCWHCGGQATQPSLCKLALPV